MAKKIVKKKSVAAKASPPKKVAVKKATKLKKAVAAKKPVKAKKAVAVKGKPAAKKVVKPARKVAQKTGCSGQTSFQGEARLQSGEAGAESRQACGKAQTQACAPQGQPSGRTVGRDS
jgi:ribosome biogenesis protein Tsr3